MAIVIPRYFAKEGQLTTLDKETLFGAEFRIHEQMRNYSLIATHHVLVFVLRGTKIIHSSSEDTVITAGNYIFIPKGSYIFSDIHPDQECAHRVVLFLDDLFLKETLSALPFNESRESNKSTTFPQGKISPLVHHALASLKPYLQKKLSLGNLLLKGKLQEILFALVEADKECQFEAYLHRVIETPKPELRSFMERHYREPLTVHEFAHLSCRSARQFQRDFKVEFNETPQKWIRHRRLEHAHQLCINSRKAISDIATEAGFQSYSHFIQLFKKQYGITPKQCMTQEQYFLSDL